MKKIILALSAAALLSVSSCTKDYTCTCTLTGTSPGYAIQNDPITGQSKTTATTTCTYWQTTQQSLVNNNGGSGTVSCSL